MKYTLRSAKLNTQIPILGNHVPHSSSDHPIAIIYRCVVCNFLMHDMLSCAFFINGIFGMELRAAIPLVWSLNQLQIFAIKYVVLLICCKERNNSLGLTSSTEWMAIDFFLIAELYLSCAVRKQQLVEEKACTHDVDAKRYKFNSTMPSSLFLPLPFGSFLPAKSIVLAP